MSEAPDKQRWVCIHGHFYQPPRENAWLEVVEHQDSAHPYHDWNERIDAECYAPNATSRILDSQDRIVRVVNNYERISFNFGPTLLSWLETHDPEIYAAILAADHASRARFSGHGSALAQAYNHAILPLCNARDKRTQVLWGLADFEHRFRRMPEGMWLPETAADLETLDVLAEYGVRFTILAPGQARETRPRGAPLWADVSGERVNPRRPYFVELPSGRTIHVFFYDGPVSRAVAFERLLARGEALAGRLLGAFVEGETGAQLVHIATDGETYGHHHTFGEMALSFALQVIETGSHARLTNYGEFLERHPPAHEARIHEPSSWSCAHGVGRWSDDCGCRVNPSWQQRWRRPLREALDLVRDDVAPRFEAAAAALFHDPWDARNGYVALVLDRSAGSRQRFFERHARRPLDAAETTRALELLELGRHAMLMYTSCGWFFDDVSGIETQQILQYAARVLQLAERLFGESPRPAFLARLADAPSNLPEQGDGRLVFERRVQPAVVDLRKVGANYAAALLFGNGGARLRPTAYDVSAVERHDMTANGARLVAGRLEARSEVTLERAELCFVVLYAGSHDLRGGARLYPGDAAYRAMLEELGEAARRNDLDLLSRLIGRHLPGPPFSLRELFRDEQHRVLARILESTLAQIEDTYRELYERHAAVLHTIAGLDAPQPFALRVAAEIALNTGLRHALEAQPPDLARTRHLLHDARASRVALDRPSLRFAARALVSRLLERVEQRPDDEERIDLALETLEVLRQIPFSIDVRDAENRCWRLSQTVLPAYRNRAAQGDELARRWVERFEALASTLRVAPS